MHFSTFQMYIICCFVWAGRETGSIVSIFWKLQLRLVHNQEELNQNLVCPRFSAVTATMAACPRRKDVRANMGNKGVSFPLCCWYLSPLSATCPRVSRKSNGPLNLSACTEGKHLNFDMFLLGVIGSKRGTRAVRSLHRWLLLCSSRACLCLVKKSRRWHKKCINL